MFLTLNHIHLRIENVFVPYTKIRLPGSRGDSAVDCMLCMHDVGYIPGTHANRKAKNQIKHHLSPFQRKTKQNKNKMTSSWRVGKLYF